MTSQFPVYTECTFKCETPEKSAEPKDCAKSCEMVKRADTESKIFKRKVDLYENMMKLFIFRIDENAENVKDLPKINTLSMIKDLFVSVLQEGSKL